MAKGAAKFELTVGAVDKFSGPFKSFGAEVYKAKRKVAGFGKALGFKKLKAGFGELSTGLGRVRSEFGAFTGRVRGLASALGIFSLAGGGLTAGIYAQIKSFSDAGSAAQDMAQKLGLTTQQWQEMAYAAKINGLESAQLEGAYSKLNLSLIAAAKGGKDQARAFKSLGVPLREAGGKLKATDALMMDLADSFAKMPDGAQKAALANKIFGQSGTQLLPFLNKGRAGLAGLRREAVNLGLVFSDEAATAAADFGSTLEQTKLKVRGLGFIVGENFLPVANELLESFNGLVEENRELIKVKTREWAKKIVDFLPRLKKGIKDVAKAVPGLIKKIDGMAQSLGGWGNVAKIAGGIMAGPLVKSILGLVGPIKTLGLAITGTPVGLVIGLAGAFAGLMAKAGVLEPFLEGVGKGFSGLSAGLDEAFKDLLEAVVDLFCDTADSLRDVNGELKPEAWRDLGEAVGQFANGTLGTLITALTKAVDLLGTLGKSAGYIAGLLGSDVAVEELAETDLKMAKLNARIKKRHDEYTAKGQEMPHEERKRFQEEIIALYTEAHATQGKPYGAHLGQRASGISAVTHHSLTHHVQKDAEAYRQKKAIDAAAPNPLQLMADNFYQPDMSLASIASMHGADSISASIHAPKKIEGNNKPAIAGNYSLGQTNPGYGTNAMSSSAKKETLLVRETRHVEEHKTKIEVFAAPGAEIRPMGPVADNVSIKRNASYIGLQNR